MQCFLLDSMIEHMYDAYVFERLAAAVEELEVPADGDALAEGYRLLDRLAAKLSASLGDWDASGQWEVEGATSVTAWLKQRAGMAPAVAHATTTVARRLQGLPVTREAWVDGSLSGGQVRVVAANVDDRTEALFAEHEPDLVPTLVPLSMEDTTRAMRLWKARAEATLPDVEGAGPKRRLHLSETLGGRFVLDGDLDPEGGSLLATALRLAATADAEGEPRRSPARQRADALVDVCRFFLDHQHHVPGGRHRPHLNVVVDYADLLAGGPGRLVEGGFLDGASIRRLLCDAAVHRVVTAGRSSILDYGTSTRTIPANLWSVLVLRDQHCRLVPGCDRPPEWCEAHHVVPVSEGGPTSLANLVLGCSRHHHLVHLPGWHLELSADGTLVITDPSGRTRTTKPPGVLASPLAA